MGDSVTTEQQICAILDKTLDRMNKVDKHLKDFRTYIRSHKEQNKPLHQWARYDGYGVLDQTVSMLDDAKSELKHILEEHECLNLTALATYLDRAARVSTSVSNTVVFALGAISHRSVTCMDEVDQSCLSDEAKHDARTYILQEIRRLIKHTARTTDRMYEATDLIQKIVHVDSSAGQQSIYRMMKSTPDCMATQRIRGGGDWAWTLARVVLNAAVSVAIGLTAAHLCGPVGFNLTMNRDEAGNALYGQIVDIVERTQALANITSELYWIRLQDVDQRYKEIETVSEAHGLRIDNLVESLGPTNAQGTYFSSTPLDRQIPVNVKAYVRKVSNDVNRQQKEMEQVRKDLLRMDIRLTIASSKSRVGNEGLSVANRD